MTVEEIAAIHQRIAELRVEHRSIDEVINQIMAQSYVDQLQLVRLKKRKLFLKDMIQKLESQLIPDISA